MPIGLGHNVRAQKARVQEKPEADYTHTLYDNPSDGQTPLRGAGD